MPIARRLALQMRDVLAVDADRSRGRRLEAGDHAQGRRLAAAAGAEEGDELAALDREVEVLDDGLGAEGLADAGQREERHGDNPSACRLEGRTRRRTSWMRPMQAQVSAKAMTASAAGS